MRHLAEICEVYEPSAVPTPIYMKVVKMQVLAWKDFRFYINNRFPLQETLPATQSISHFYRQSGQGAARILIVKIVLITLT